MPNISYGKVLSGIGGNINNTVVRSADGGGNLDPELPRGFTGTLTTRTDDNTGTVTLAGGHGITTGMKVDIYWDDKVHYNVTVGTVATNSMPFDNGVGDNLPVQSTEVVVSPRVEINLTIDDLSLVLIGAVSKYTASNETSRSHIDFYNAEDDELYGTALLANDPWVRDIVGGDTVPFVVGGEVEGPVTKAFASNGSATNDSLLQILWLQDSTPSN